MHTLLFLEPGHFHAALTLRERHPLVSDEIVVYVALEPGRVDGGREVVEFLDLLGAFNRRAERPTRWRPVIRAGPEPLARLVRERPGDVVIVAGRNDQRKANPAGETTQRGKLPHPAHRCQRTASPSFRAASVGIQCRKRQHSEPRASATGH